MRQILKTCRNIFIYRKIGDRFLNDNESNETDTETSDENNSLSHGKFMKKRKLPRFSNAKVKVDERSRYLRVEFKPVYIAEGDFGSRWVNENHSKLDFLTVNLIQFVNVSLSKRSCNYVSYRHCLFLESKLGILNKLCDTKHLSNNKLSTSLSMEFIFNLEMHICQKLCMREKLVYLAEDNSIMQSCTSIGLVFKKSVKEEKSELAKYLKTPCNFDLKNVTFIRSFLTQARILESVIYYTQRKN